MDPPHRPTPLLMLVVKGDDVALADIALDGLEGI